MSELRPGDRVAELVVDGVLSAGGFGALYRCRDASGGALALKVLLPELAAAPAAVSRFEREIEVIRKLDHPGVITIRAYGRLADGRPYYAMDLLSGEDVAARVTRTGPLSAAPTVEIVSRIAAALDAAHAAGVVHRDVKPSNVFLCDPDDTPVLLDFGIAKLAGASLSLTLSRQAVGSAASMAPEQLGRGAVDARTDVYGLAVVTYFLLCGQLPFGADSALLTAQLHRFARRPRPSAVVRQPAGVDAAVVRAMSIDPDERFASAGEFARALSAAVDTTGDRRRVSGTAVRVDIAESAEAAIPEVLRYFREHQFVPVFEGSWTCLYVRAEPATVELAIDGVQVHVTDGELIMRGDRPVGGVLLDLGDWV